MSAHAPRVRKSADTELFYTVDGEEATIVGACKLNASHLEIPAVITDGAARYRVTAIGEAAFSYQSALQTVALPPTLCRIEHGAFECSGLTEVQLHDGLTCLAPYAFWGCAHLSRVILPSKGLSALPEQVFGACPALQRSGVTNLNRIHLRDMQDCGLQDLTRRDKPSVTVVVNGAAPDSAPIDENSPEALLLRGQQLEAEGRTADAAVFYMQAHDLRAEAAGNVDMHTRVAETNAIAEAEYRLGVLLKLSLAPERNADGSPRPTAADLLHLAADTANLADAMYHLGDLYAGGYGMSPDPAAALRYLKRAAALGHERACLDLGFVYTDGTLDQPDFATARMYLSKCAAFDGSYSAIAEEELARLERAGE